MPVEQAKNFWVSLSKTSQTLVAISGLLASAFGGWFVLESRLTPRYVHESAVQDIEEDMQTVGVRLDQKIIQDQLANARDELFWIKKRMGQDCGSMAKRCATLKTTIKDLEADLAQIRAIKQQEYKQYKQWQRQHKK